MKIDPGSTTFFSRGLSESVLVTHRSDFSRSQNKKALMLKPPVCAVFLRSSNPRRIARENMIVETLARWRIFRLRVGVRSKLIRRESSPRPLGSD